VSHENVEIVRKGNDAFRRGDWDALAANLDAHVLLRTDARWPEQYIYGLEAAMAFYRSAWESIGPDVRIEEIVDLGDRVLVRLCWIVSGQHSGAEGELRWTEIVTYREGHTILNEFFFEHAHALKAVGLEE
jgi:SnoaL-like domain